MEKPNLWTTAARPAVPHLVLLHLVLDVLQIRTQRLSPHPLNPRFRHIQPVRELLQLLVLQVHQHLVESGSRETIHSASCQGHAGTSAEGIIKACALAPYSEMEKSTYPAPLFTLVFGLNEYRE